MRPVQHRLKLPGESRSAGVVTKTNRDTEETVMSSDNLEVEDSKTGAPTKVFTPEFLAAIRRMDGVSNMGEAERSRPLSIVSGPDGLWQVETVGSTNTLLGRFSDRELAVLFCSAYPTVDRDVPLQLGMQPADGWYPVWWTRGKREAKCGELKLFEEDTVNVMKSLLSLVGNPVTLSYLLEFAGWTALDAAGDILLRRLQEEGSIPGGRIVTETSSAFDELLRDATFRKDFEGRLTAGMSTVFAELMAAGRVLVLPAGLSDAVGLSGGGLQEELRRVLASGLVRQGYVTGETAAEVAGVPRSELDAFLRRYGVETSEAPG